MVETVPATLPQKPPKARKQRRGTKAKPTAKQKRLIQIFTENALTGGSLSMPDMLRKAGYAEESARQMINILAGVQPHLAPIEDRIAAHREKVMERMEKAVDYADYGQLTRGLVATTQIHRLLTGKTTANVGVIVEERRKAIDRLIDE